MLLGDELGVDVAFGLADELLPDGVDAGLLAGDPLLAALLLAAAAAMQASKASSARPARPRQTAGRRQERRGARSARSTRACGNARSSRHPDDRPQAAHRAVVQRDVAAMAARDVAGDRQAETGAAFVLVARRVQPEEGAEHVFAPLGGNAGAVVVDDDGQPPARMRRPDAGLLGIAEGVADDVGEQPGEGMRPDLHFRARR